MKKFFALFFVLTIISCTSNTIFEKPKDLIPKDTMVALLKDIYIATSAKNVKNIKLQRPVNYMPLVYNKYRIDSTRFSNSNIYYTSVLEDYNEILLEVKSRLKIQQEKFKKEIKKLDSIKNKEKEERVKQNKQLLEEGKIKIDSSFIKSKSKFKTKLPTRDRN